MKITKKPTHRSQTKEVAVLKSLPDNQKHSNKDMSAFFNTSNVKKLSFATSGLPPLIVQREEHLRSVGQNDKQHQVFVQDLIHNKSSKEGLSPQTLGHQRSQDSLTSMPKGLSQLEIKMKPSNEEKLALQKKNIILNVDGSGAEVQTSDHQFSFDHVSQVLDPKLNSPSTLSPTKLSLRNATNFLQAMIHENDMQRKKSQTMAATTLEPLPIVIQPKFVSRKDVEANQDEVQAAPFIKIAERISKLPEVKNAWMRKREAMQQQRSKSLQAHLSKWMPETAETLDQEQFETADPEKNRVIQVQQFSDHLHEDTQNEPATLKHEDSDRQQWQAYLSSPKAKPEVFSHNIFTEEQKSQAKVIFQTRLESLRAGNKEWAQHTDKQSLGNLYQLLLKEEPSRLISKRNSLAAKSSQMSQPLPPILSKSPSSNCSSQNEIQQFRSFLEKRQQSLLVDSVQYIEVMKNKKPLTKQSNKSLMSNMTNESEQVMQAKVAQRLQSMQDYLSNLQSEISKSQSGLQQTLAINMKEAQLKRLSKLPADIHLRSFLDLTKSKRAALTERKHQPIMSDKTESLSAISKDFVSANDQVSLPMQNVEDSIARDSSPNAQDLGISPQVSKATISKPSFNFTNFFFNQPKPHGKSPEEAHIDDVKRLVTSVPNAFRDLLDAGAPVEHTDFGAPEWQEFRATFLKIVKNELYYKAFRSYGQEVLHPRMFKELHLIEKSKMQEAILSHMLQQDKVTDQALLPLSHMRVLQTKFKNEPFSNDLRTFVEQVTQMDDKAAGEYIKDIFAKMHLGGKQSSKTALNRKQVEVVNGVEYGFVSSSESESEGEKAHQTNIFTAKSAGQPTQRGSSDYLMKLFKRLQFSEIMKTGYKGANKHPQNDAQIQFCKRISKGQQLAVPLLQQEGQSKNRLQVVDQLLSDAKLEAFIDSAKYMDKLQYLVLQNTNLSDQSFARLLSNINSCALFFKSVKYCGQNLIGSESIQQLQRFFNRKFPHQFEELRLEQVRLHLDCSLQLLSTIASSVTLNTLSLSDLELKPECLPVICEYISDSNTLIELSLTHMHIQANSFLRILEALCDNPDLEKINLAGNQLIDRSVCDGDPDAKNELKIPEKRGTAEKRKFKPAIAQDTDSSENDETISVPPLIARRNTMQKSSVGSPSPMFARQSSTVAVPAKQRISVKRATEKAVRSLIEEIISSNRNLTHLDLTYTGFSRSMFSSFLSFLTAYERPSNLQALHLTINEPDYETGWINQMKVQLGQAPDIEEFLPEQAQFKKHQSVDPSDMTLAGQSRTQRGLLDESRIICLNRLVGYQMSMQQHADRITFDKWRLNLGTAHTHCWHCQQPIFTIFLLELNGEEVKMADDLELQFYQKSVPMCVQTSRGDVKQRFNLQRVQELCQRFEAQNFAKKDFVSILINAGLCSPEVADDPSLIKKKEQVRLDQLIESYKYQAFQLNWQNVLNRHLSPRKPVIVGQVTPTEDNPNTVDTFHSKGGFIDPSTQMTEKRIQDIMDSMALKPPSTVDRQVLICPIFLKPGKHAFQFVSKSSGQVFRLENQSNQVPTSTYALTHFCEAAPELQAPQYYLKTKVYLQQPFEKQKSIFVEWKDDEIIQQKLIQESDFKYWGVAKIIKNETDVSIYLLLPCLQIRFIKSLLSKHMGRLTDIFVELASSDACYPKVNFTIFADFCKWAMLMTEEQPVEEVKAELQLSRASTIRSNNNKASPAKTPKSKPTLTEIDIANEYALTCLPHDQIVMPDQIPKDMFANHENWMRKRQYEVVLESRCSLDRCQFLEMLVRCAVFKYIESGHEKSPSIAVKNFVVNETLKYVRTKPLHSFRKETLWTQKINLILESNAIHLHQVYDSLIDVKKKAVNYKRVTRRLLIRKFGLSPETARKLYARSKMQVVNEKTHGDQYLRLKFVEFLELLGRVAHHGMTMQQEQKEFEFYLSKVIDQVLGPLGLHRVKPEHNMNLDDDD